MQQEQRPVQDTCSLCRGLGAGTEGALGAGQGTQPRLGTPGCHSLLLQLPALTCLNNFLVIKFRALFETRQKVHVKNYCLWYGNVCSLKVISEGSISVQVGGILGVEVLGEGPRTEQELPGAIGWEALRYHVSRGNFRKKG